MARPLVLLTQPIHDTAMRRLEESAVLRVAEDRTETGLIAAVKGAAALIVRDPISAAVVMAGESLRVIARHGVGTDYIPVDVCTQRRIPVTITPDANSSSVAEWVIGAMIALSHRFGIAARRAREGEWSRRDGLTGFELGGRTLGIVGFGRIGARVAKMASVGLSMRVIAFDPIRDRSEIEATGAVAMSFDEVLGKADVISLHVPATPETRRLIDANKIGLMRPGVLLINSARGSLVETDALVAALADGRIAGAALDGLELEPPAATHPLLSFDNVLLTPHSAALTEEALVRMGNTAAEEVLRVLAGQPPLHSVNGQF